MAKQVEETTPEVAMISLDQVQALIDKGVKDALSMQTPKSEGKREVVSESNKQRNEIPGLENFEFKDRTYRTLGEAKAISEDILNRHKLHSPLQWYNSVTNKLMTLRYATNQSSFFTEEQTGDVLIGYITMHDGFLRVPKENVTLQKFLAIHPHNGSRFEELDPTKENQKITDAEDVRFEAETLARKLSTIEQEAIVRLLCFDYRDDWDSSRIKKEIYQKAKENPVKFIKYAKDDTLKIKGIIKTAIAREYIAYRNYTFFDQSGEVIVHVNRNDDEIDVMVEFLATNKGAKLYEYLKEAVC